MRSKIICYLRLMITFSFRKRRYFILRRDIGELCYFDSLEKLTLLGTVPLSKDSIIWEVDPNDVDGVRNVIAVKSRGPQTLNDAFLMR